MDLKEFEDKLQKTSTILNDELATIQANRVSPTSLKNVIVMIDTQKFSIMELAMVRVINAQTLGVKPWEAKNCAVIEKSIKTANLGLMVGAKDDELHVSFPELTQERRKEIAKSLNNYSLNAKNAIRSLRNDFIKLNKKGSKEEEVKQEKDIQKLIDKYNSTIDAAIEKKQKEIMQL